MGEIDTGDHVHHAPTGEHWLVAYVNGEYLCACGWPESLAKLSDCMLIYKASDAERHRLLVEMQNTEGSRGLYARHRLSEMERSNG